MAIYHLSLKAVSRSDGRNAVAAAAYRSAEKLHDDREDREHDYRRKEGVIGKGLAVPEGAGWSPRRGELWNAAESAEKRKDACVAREHEVALPAELTPGQRAELVKEYAQDLANRHGVAVDWAIHAPHREGDQRNWHAHLLCTTRKVEGRSLGQKADREKAGAPRRELLQVERERWSQLQNRALEVAGLEQRVDHRSLEDQAIGREPMRHLGPHAVGIERRTGKKSRRRLDMEAQQPNQERKADNEAGRKADSRPTVTIPGKGDNKAGRKADKPLAELPLHHQAQILEMATERAYKVRRAKNYRRSQQAQRRYEKRYEALERHQKQKPLEPAWILAPFKGEDYRRSLEAWNRELARLDKLRQQAWELVKWLEKNYDNAAHAWANNLAARKQPALVARVQEYRRQQSRKRHQEWLQKLEREEQERQREGPKRTGPRR